MARNIMVRNVMIVAVLVVMTLAATWWMGAGGAPRPVQEVPVADDTYERAGERAPDFEFTRMDGTAGRLRDYNDRIVVLNFWASWCVPCIVEFPQMVNLAQMMPEEIVVLAVSVDAEAAAIGRFLARHGAGYEDAANFVIAHDPQKEISQDLFQTVKLPETILIAPGGVMREKIVGANVKWDDAAMMARLRGLAAPYTR